MTRLACLFASILATGAVSVTAGCLPSSPVKYSGDIEVASTELVQVNPEVKVVADSAEPLFFALGSYWLFHDGAWYQSREIHGTWIKDTTPPVPVVQIDQPYAFTHYRVDHPDVERTATR